MLNVNYQKCIMKMNVIRERKNNLKSKERKQFIHKNKLLDKHSEFQCNYAFKSHYYKQMHHSKLCESSI